MADEQVIQQGDQASQQQQQQQSPLGWRSALPDEFKEHDFVKSFQRPGDFVKSALEIKTERDALKTKVEKAIFKPDEKAKPEEVSAYRKSMGIPEKAEEYEFPKDSGIEHDQVMETWAKSVFHEAGLSKSQASLIGQKWDGFIKGMVEAEEKAAEEIKTVNEKKFRDQFKNDDEHKAGMELARRFWKKITNTEFDEIYKDAEAWQVPMFMNFVFATAKAVGEDWSPKGGTARTGEQKVGIKYDKTDFSQFKGG